MVDELIVVLDFYSGYKVIELLCWLVKEGGCIVLMVIYDFRIVSYVDRVVYFEDGVI